MFRIELIVHEEKSGQEIKDYIANLQHLYTKLCLIGENKMQELVVYYVALDKATDEKYGILQCDREIEEPVPAGTKFFVVFPTEEEKILEALKIAFEYSGKTYKIDERIQELEKKMALLEVEQILLENKKI